MAEWFFQSKSSRPPLLPTASSTSCPSSANQDNRASKRTKLMDKYFKPSDLSSPPAPPSDTPSAPPSTLAQVSTAYHGPASQPTFYPDAICSSSTPHPHVTVEPVKTAHIPALMRTTGLLLPVRYPNSFYTATITDPVIASVSRVALYHDPSSEITRKTASYTPSAYQPSAARSENVIGGIRCRLEPLLPPSATDDSDTGPAHNLYIQTLHLLSPYRENGIATSLLDSILYASPANATASNSSSPRPVSAIVRHYGIRIVTAHVHETNEDALSWYKSRGFTIRDGVVEGYYRRLSPGGAKVVELVLGADAEHSNSQSAPTETEVRDAASEDGDDDDGDGDWEKVDAEECGGIEKLEDYDAIDPKIDLDKKGPEKAKSRR